MFYNVVVTGHCVTSPRQVRGCDTRKSGGSTLVWALSHTKNNFFLSHHLNLALEDLVSVEEGVTLGNNVGC